ncbi:MAG: NfeD family protein [Limnobacter sp.]|uniref:NfeD family protein n=1 Tax=Limnobacter sp. TaxID=2003368 RepID=UPI0022CC29CE|nr:NfeD family protein [Limnobacter sp.]MCZ8015391.1 NfeD family protein [Limnobacter sp.]
MSNFSLWLVLAGILLIAEITTGTFYLLMVSLGAAVGALMAYLGYGLESQIATAAVLAVAGSLLLRNRSINRSKTDKQHDVLDIGNKLQVTSWDANGRASVQYRGANWAAESTESTPVTGLHQIVDVQGNILKVKSVSTHA